MHWRHFRALWLKRANISRRDWKALVFQLILPVVMVAAGLGLLQVTHQQSY
jgi:hypothetical protein